MTTRRTTMKLTTRQKASVGLAVASLVCFLAVRVLYLPVFARIGERRATLTDLQVKVADAREFGATLPAEEAALRATSARNDTLERRLGEGQSVARILEALSEQAGDHRLQLVAVQPRAEEREERAVKLGSDLTLRAVPLALTLTGRYQQVGEFLGELGRAPFVASVEALSMTKPDAGSPKLQADLELAVYLKATDPPSGELGIVSPDFPDVTAQREEQRQRATRLAWSRDPFTLSPTSVQGGELTLSGIMWDTHQPIAVINGRLVGVGAELEGYRVVDILEDRVDVTDGTQTFHLTISP